jgi:hypothetical protein
LITTFATTPLVSWLYPPDYQKKIAAWKRGEINWEGNPINPADGDSSAETVQKLKSQANISKITVLLRLENLPGIFAFVELLGGKTAPKPKIHKAKAIQSGTIEEEGNASPPETPAGPAKRPVEVHGERLVELTQRTSAVMQVSEVAELQEKDAVVNVFRTFGSFHNVAVSASLSIVPQDDFAEVITNKASVQSSDLLLIPWTESGTISEADEPTMYTAENRFMSHQHNQFITHVLERAPCSTAIMVNRGFGLDRLPLHRTASFHSMRSRKQSELANVVSPILDPSHHIFFPFFGGADDRAALRFVLQLASNINVTATIVRVVYSADAADPGLEFPPATSRRDLPRNLSHTHVPLVTGVDESESASTTTAADADSAFFQSMQDSLPRAVQNRVVFETVKTPQPLRYVVGKARAEVGQSKNAGDLIVLGRGLKNPAAHIRSELVEVLEALGVPSGTGADSRRCLGDVAEACIVANVKASLVVFQADGRMLESELPPRDVLDIDGKSIEAKF